VNREQLSHVLRAASRVADDPDIIVIGSQAILGSFSDADLPIEATRSMEADLAFRNDIDERKSDLVDGSIGEYRLVAYMEADSAPSRATCLEPHDLVVSKLVAGRLKDIEFVKAMLGANLISANLLVERAEMLEVPRAVITRVRSTISRLLASPDRT